MMLTLGLASDANLGLASDANLGLARNDGKLVECVGHVIMMSWIVEGGGHSKSCGASWDVGP